MFFFEWVVPVLAIVAIFTVAFYLAVRNKPGAGVRTDGRDVSRQANSDEEQTPR